MTEFFRFATDSPSNFIGTISLLFIFYAMFVGVIQCLRSPKK